LKRHIRTIGIDDGHFVTRTGNALVIGAVIRGRDYLEGILSTTVSVDGDDSTAKLSKMIKGSKFYPQLRAILINGTTLAGFNVIEIEKLNEQTGLPVLCITRRPIDFPAVMRALKKVRNPESKLKRLYRGEQKKHGKIYYMTAGRINAQEVIGLTTIHSHIPEPIRIAHIIASGVSTGESVKRV
jgi:endonuclease V-like protein UPF0215 family